MNLEKAIQENTAAMLKLAESNILLAESFTGTKAPQPAQGGKVVKINVTNGKKPEGEEEPKQEKKAPAKREFNPTKPKAEEAPGPSIMPAGELPKAETKPAKITGDDLRKVAGKCIADGKKAEFKAVLTQFETANITVFEKDEDSDMTGMLAALEEVAGCKLAEIAD